jgi:hypothetical protein
MKRMQHDPMLAELPAPIALSLEQLTQVASDTGAMLGAGGGCVIICGGYPPEPVYGLTPASAPAGLVPASNPMAM